MYHSLLTKPSFHVLLMKIDDDLAGQASKEGCACGGPLHQANYPRSSLGLPVDCREYYQQRRSFCCGRCRKRLTIKSVRFFGRYRFPVLTIVLISLLKCRVTKRALTQVQRHFNVTISKRTWKRWLKWWRTGFVATKFWKQVKGLIPIDCLSKDNPRSLLIAYSGSINDRLVAIFQFLAPLTAGVHRAV